MHMSTQEWRRSSQLKEKCAIRIWGARVSTENAIYCCAWGLYVRSACVCVCLCQCEWCNFLYLSRSPSLVWQNFWYLCKWRCCCGSPPQSLTQRTTVSNYVLACILIVNFSYSFDSLYSAANAGNENEWSGSEEGGIVCTSMQSTYTLIASDYFSCNLSSLNLFTMDLVQPTLTRSSSTIHPSIHLHFSIRFPVFRRHHLEFREITTFALSLNATV